MNSASNKPQRSRKRGQLALLAPPRVDAPYYKSYTAYVNDYKMYVSFVQERRNEASKRKPAEKPKKAKKAQPEAKEKSEAELLGIAARKRGKNRARRARKHEKKLEKEIKLAQLHARLEDARARPVHTAVRVARELQASAATLRKEDVAVLQAVHKQKRGVDAHELKIGSEALGSLPVNEGTYRAREALAGFVVSATAKLGLNPSPSITVASRSDYVAETLKLAQSARPKGIGATYAAVVKKPLAIKPAMPKQPKPPKGPAPSASSKGKAKAKVSSSRQAPPPEESYPGALYDRPQIERQMQHDASSRVHVQATDDGWVGTNVSHGQRIQTRSPVPQDTGVARYNPSTGRWEKDGKPII